MDTLSRRAFGHLVSAGVSAAALPSLFAQNPPAARSSGAGVRLSSNENPYGPYDVPSETNFIMIDFKRNVRPVIAAMRERNVQVGRHFPAMPQYLRVTIGRPEEMQRFMSAFRAVVA